MIFRPYVSGHGNLFISAGGPPPASDVMYDQGSNDADGAYSGVVYGDADGIEFDGVNDYADMYSTAFTGLFDLAIGTIYLRAEYISLNEAHARDDTLFAIGNNGTNDDVIRFNYDNGSGRWICWLYAGNTYLRSKYVATLTLNSPLTHAHTWSETADDLQSFIDGSFTDDDGGIGTFTNKTISASQCVLGAGTLTADFANARIRDFIYTPTYGTTDISSISSKIAAKTLTASDLNTAYGSGNWIWYKMDETS